MKRMHALLVSIWKSSPGVILPQSKQNNIHRKRPLGSLPLDAHKPAAFLVHAYLQAVRHGRSLCRRRHLPPGSARDRLPDRSVATEHRLAAVCQVRCAVRCCAAPWRSRVPRRRRCLVVCLASDVQAIAYRVHGSAAASVRRRSLPLAGRSPQQPAAQRRGGGPVVSGALAHAALPRGSRLRRCSTAVNPLPLSSICACGAAVGPLAAAGALSPADRWLVLIRCRANLCRRVGRRPGRVAAWRLWCTHAGRLWLKAGGMQGALRPWEGDGRPPWWRACWERRRLFWRQAEAACRRRLWHRAWGPAYRRGWRARRRERHAGGRWGVRSRRRLWGLRAAQLVQQRLQRRALLQQLPSHLAW